MSVRERLSWMWGDLLAAVVCSRRGHRLVPQHLNETHGAYVPCTRCWQKVRR